MASTQSPAGANIARSPQHGLGRLAAWCFYQQVFGGQISITRRGDVDPTAAPEQNNQVINALLTGGDITLRASDREDASASPQPRIELSLIGTDEERLRPLFDGLAQGGTVRTQLERQFWGDIFGAVTDKYGVGWQVNIGTGGALTLPAQLASRPRRGGAGRRTGRPPSVPNAGWTASPGFRPAHKPERDILRAIPRTSSAITTPRLIGRTLALRNVSRAA